MHGLHSLPNAEVLSYDKLITIYICFGKKRDDTFNNTYSNISITTIQSQAFTSVNTLLRVNFLL